MPGDKRPRGDYAVCAMRVIINWLLSAIALLVVAHVVRGFHVAGFMNALWAALVIGLVNATLGALLKLITLPLTVVTLGIFWLVINALMLEFASWFAPGFRVAGFWPAFWGAIVLSLLNMFLRWLVWPKREREFRD
jgi:putative membrane protein